MPRRSRFIGKAAVIAFALLGGCSEAPQDRAGKLQRNEQSAAYPTFDPGSARLFTLDADRGTVEALAWSAAGPRRVGRIDVSAFGARAGGLAVGGGLVAVAVTARDPRRAAMLAVYRASDLLLVGATVIGPLPDRLAFAAGTRQVHLGYRGDPQGECRLARAVRVRKVDLADPAAPRLLPRAAFEVAAPLRTGTPAIIAATGCS